MPGPPPSFPSTSVSPPPPETHVGIGHVEPGASLSVGIIVGILAVLMTITLSAWASAIHGINDVLDHERIAVKLTDGELRVGDTIHVKGHSSDFTQTVNSIQIEHDKVESRQ